MKSSDEMRFLAKVDKNGPIPALRPELGPCWIWKASKNGQGYGQFWYRGRLRQAHAVSYEMYVEPIPEGKEPDHLCRTRDCVNHAHLEPVSHQENNRRAEALTNQACLRGQKKAAAGILPPAVAFQREKTHCPKGHAYDEANTRHKNGKRHCRACARERYHRTKGRGALRANGNLF